MNERPLRLLWFNLVTDADAPNLGFTTEWINALAPHCERIDVITMRVRSHRRGAQCAGLLAGRRAGSQRIPARPEVLPAAVAAAAPARLRRLLRSHATALRCDGRATVASLQNTPDLWYTHRSVTLRLRLAERAATRVVSASPESFRLPSDKLRVIGHGIDTQRFTPAPPPSGPFHYPQSRAHRAGQASRNHHRCCATAAGARPGLSPAPGGGGLSAGSSIRANAAGTGRGERPASPR